MSYYVTGTSNSTASSDWTTWTGTAGTSIYTTVYISNSAWDDLLTKNLPDNLIQSKAGLPLQDFLELWKDFKVIEVERQEYDDKIAIRYNIISEEDYYYNYGRHLGVLVVIDRTGKVTQHQVYNIREADL